MATCVLFRLQNKRLITSNALWRKNTNNILSLILDMNYQNFLHPSILDFLNGNMLGYYDKMQNLDFGPTHQTGGA